MICIVYMVIFDKFTPLREACGVVYYYCQHEIGTYVNIEAIFLYQEKRFQEKN